MGKRRRNGSWVVMLTLTGALAVLPACAAQRGLAPEAPADPGDAAEPPPETAPLDTVDAAHAELDRAASELELALSGLGAGGDRSYASPPGDDPSAMPDAPTADELEAQGQPTRAQPHAAGRGCTVACRALASMRRAASRLCAITHADDPRCVRAERRLARASGQVQRACRRCGS